MQPVRGEQRGVHCLGQGGLPDPDVPLSARGGGSGVWIMLGPRGEHEPSASMGWEAAGSSLVLRALDQDWWSSGLSTCQAWGVIPLTWGAQSFPGAHGDGFYCRGVSCLGGT